MFTSKFPPSIKSIFNTKSTSILFLLVVVAAIFLVRNQFSVEEDPVKSKTSINEDFKKVKVASQNSAAEDITRQELNSLIHKLFSSDYSTQIKTYQLTRREFLDNINLASELCNVAMKFLPDDDKFIQYKVVQLLSETSFESLKYAGSNLQTYLRKMESKVYCGPKMKKNISIIKNKLSRSS